MKKSAIVMLTVLCGVIVFAVGATHGDKKPSGTAQAWEYKVMSATDMAQIEKKLSISELKDADALKQRERQALETMNALGAEGWELIVVNESAYYIFKRPKATPAEMQNV